MCKKFHFRGPFDKWHGKRARTLLKSEPQHLYHIYWSLWRPLRLKKSLWVICKILGLFNNPLTADDKYSLLITENRLQHFQMHVSQKRKTFSLLFFAFPQVRLNFEHFQKKGDPYSWCIFGRRDSKKRGYINVWKVTFQMIVGEVTW